MTALRAKRNRKPAAAAMLRGEKAKPAAKVVAVLAGAAPANAANR